MDFVHKPEPSDELIGNLSKKLIFTRNAELSDNLPQKFRAERINELISSLLQKLKAQGLFMCTAESCTGGLIAALCTNKAGSSEWFNGGIVSYSNAMKIKLLGVPEAVLAKHGAVSIAVVEQMAQGAMGACEAQAAIAVSGIAGPGGGSPEKPVGTVCLAVSLQKSGNGKPCIVSQSPLLCGDLHIAKQNTPLCGELCITSQTAHFTGNRESVRQQAALRGFEMLLKLLG